MRRAGDRTTDDGDGQCRELLNRRIASKDSDWILPKTNTGKTKTGEEAQIDITATTAITEIRVAIGRAQDIILTLVRTGIIESTTIMSAKTAVGIHVSPKPIPDVNDLFTSNLCT